MTSSSSSPDNKTILLTGAGPNGITGRRIFNSLKSNFNIIGPSSQELNLTDFDAVSEFFDKNNIDFIIHSAIYRTNSITGDSKDSSNAVEANIRMFHNLLRFAPEVEKFIYFGSGAEYDKSRAIISISEENFGNRIPKDSYGLWKYIIAKEAVHHPNIYNFRIFGTINPVERPGKNVISNLCAKAAFNRPLTLNRDCRFSFIDIDDVVEIIRFVLLNDLTYRDYNITLPENYLLSDIAKIINEINNSTLPIIFAQEGLNLEYSANNSRLSAEYNHFTPIKKSIEKVLDYMKLNIRNIDLESLDQRWKR